ncbi:MAG: hypothetical protein Q7R93_00590 [bacterium]|nr:hypothetical protein [bacterium]
MKIRTLLAFFLTLFVVGVSAQQTSTFRVQSPEDDIKYVEAAIVSPDGARAASIRFMYEKNQGEFFSVLRNEVKKLPLTPPAGYESAKYMLTFYTYADLGEINLSYNMGSRAYYEGWTNQFELINVEGNLTLPDKALQFKQKYPGGFFFTPPNVLDFEVRVKTAAGREAVFSTKSQVNTFGNLVSCTLPSSTQTLKGSGILQLAREFVVSNDPNRWWKSEEQEIILWVKPQPRLAISLNEDGDLELSATGLEGYLTLDMLEESTDLEAWSSPPQLLRRKASASGPLVIQRDGPKRFYRVRLPSDTLNSASSR